MAEVNTSKGNVRVWDEKDTCLQCGNIFVKLPQHLVSHSTEIDVIDFFRSTKIPTKGAVKLEKQETKETIFIA